MPGTQHSWILSGGGTVSHISDNMINVLWADLGTFKLSVVEYTAYCYGDTSSLTITTFPHGGSAGVLISADNNPVCTGDSVTFTVLLTNGGSSPLYKWYVNSVFRSQGFSPMFTYHPSDGDQVKATMNSNKKCVDPSPVTSDTVSMIVASKVPAAISISTPTTTVCPGTNVVVKAKANNGGTSPAYSWYINGVKQIMPNVDLLSFVPVNGDMVYVELLSNLGCALPNQDTSSVIKFTVNGSLIVSESIEQLPTMCHNDTIQLKASPQNEGLLPVYEWYRNNILLPGENRPVFNSMLDKGDLVYSKVTSSLSCAAASSNPATSNVITIARPDTLMITKVDTTNAFCNLPNGKIKINAKGGTGALLYSLSSSGGWRNFPLFDTLRPDWYYINVKDANGCTASNGSYQLLSDPAPQVTTAGGGK